MRTEFPLEMLSMGRRARRPASPRARRLGWCVLAVLIGLGAASAVLGARAAFAPRTVARRMFADIRTTALLTGRDPAAAVAKARFRTGVMMHDFGMTRDQAAAYVARVMIEEAGGLCSGI